MKIKKFNDYTRFIITDDREKPMAWDKGSQQLCYCDNEQWRDEPFPVSIYSKRQARRHIRKSKSNRKQWKMDVLNYLLFPVA